MQVTHVEIERFGDGEGDQVLAHCVIELDNAWIVRDIRLLRGKPERGPFVAMPNRKYTDLCPQCHVRNALDAKYCEQCGLKRDEGRIRDRKLFLDMIFPKNSESRAQLEEAVIGKYKAALRRKMEECDVAFS